MNALVVDDDSLNRELLQRMLVRLGWRVDEASNGRSAIACCGKARYDMVFVDVLMPGMDGLATAKAIRKLYAKEDYQTCVLAVTGSYCDAASSALFDGVLSKPFVLEELSTSINAAPQSRDKRGKQNPE
ncbi:MAG: hypothetical protein A2Y38_18225 [Spirochaetes bacterium GWB1_59_5]|nr:MAG: hypothetical protein A2Y38_18225 [Spirochaetes bacterium GWB1_59_5]